jgi:hypothetical protein
MTQSELTLKSYFDVLDACAKPGCPLCRLSEQVINRYLDAILYESVNDPGIREQFHRSLGYCSEAAVQSLQSEATCPACVQRDRMETIALIAMLKALAQEDERMQAALRSSAGLCLPHLRRVLELARDQAAFERLLAITQEKIAELAGELDEFIRKNDYRFSQEGFGAEGDSWQRAIAWMVGARGVR